jgi:hypothetical protein
MTTYIDHTNAGAEVEITDEAKAKWMLDNGYISPKTASKAKDADQRGVYVTSPPADKDITLAENREQPTPPSKIEPHVANDVEPEGTEIVHGKNMGLDAEPVAPTGPEVEIKVGGDEKPKTAAKGSSKS